MRKLFVFIALLLCFTRIPIQPPHKAVETKKPTTIAVRPSQKPHIMAESFTPPVQPKYTLTGGCEQYRALIQKYEWDSRLFMAIMEAESRCVSNRVGDDYPINGVHAVSCGLMQVRTIAPWRGTCEQLKDPEFNIDIAYKVYVGQGLTAWSTYTNGAYLRYIR